MDWTGTVTLAGTIKKRKKSSSISIRRQVLTISSFTFFYTCGQAHVLYKRRRLLIHVSLILHLQSNVDRGSPGFLWENFIADLDQLRRHAVREEQTLQLPFPGGQGGQRFLKKVKK